MIYKLANIYELCMNKFTQYAKSKYHIEIRSEVRKVANLLDKRVLQKFNRLPQVLHSLPLPLPCHVLPLGDCK